MKIRTLIARLLGHPRVVCRESSSLGGYRTAVRYPGDPGRTYWHITAARHTPNAPRLHAANK